MNNHSLTFDECEIMDVLENGPVLRKFLSKSEIKAANSLTKKGLINKGHSDDKQKSVQFSKL